MKGEYELTIAFLKFLTASIPTKKPSSTLVGCLVYTFGEIFAQYCRWHYKKEHFKHSIGYYCFEAAHAALNLNYKADRDTLETVKIVRAALLTGRPGEQLLRTIQTGRELVKSVIDTSGSDTLLLRDIQVIMIRKSLSVLNQLLRLKELDSPSESNKSKLTAVEMPLFDPTSLASKGNMLVIFARYVYRTHDSRLAALAGK